MPTKTFPLPTDALLPGSASELELGADVRADVLQALATKTKPFPPGPISLGTVSLQGTGGATVALGQSAAAVALGASVQARMGLAVLDSPAAVVEALALGDDRPVPIEAALQPDDPTDARYVLFHAGYDVEGSVEATHPIGGFGAAAFGAEASRRHSFGVIHRIGSATAAQGAVLSTVGSIRLPRQVSSATDLSPGTMIVSEVSGSLALRLSAQLGWDLNMVRELEDLGLTGDVGLKIDLGVQAALGFEASGRYLVALDRPTDAESLRLRLFKLSRSGWQFGLNLAATVDVRADLPEHVDDFVTAVFGVHGQQVVRELKRLEQWTDPETDPLSLVAGLTARKAFELLESTTGIDPEQEFERARNRLLEALKLWDDVPEHATEAARSLLDRIPAGDEALRARLDQALLLIAGDDPDARRAALVELIGLDDFEQTPLGEFLVKVAPNGVLSLLEDTSVGPVAARVRRLLDGGELSSTLARIHAFVGDALDLEQIEAVASETDFAAVNEWLVRRLSAVFGEVVTPATIRDVQATVRKVIALRQAIWEKARSAVNRSYDLSVAASWQKSTAKTALLDVEFDTSRAGARRMLAEVLGNASYDELLVRVVDGVRLHQATLSHGIERSSSLDVTLPFYSAKTVRLNQSLADVSIEAGDGRVLVYSLEAQDEARRRGQFRSRVAVSAAVSMDLPGVRVHRSPSGSWSYSYRFVERDMKSDELRDVLQPLARKYFPFEFTSGNVWTFPTWVFELDREVETVTGNGPNEFGDVLLSLDVVSGADVLGPWLARRTRPEAEQAARDMSRALQSALRRMLLFHNTQDLDRLKQNEPMAALLVWAALPTANEVRIVGNQLDEVESGDVFWNWRDRTLRRALVGVGRDTLTASLGALRGRLESAGRLGDAAFFVPDEVDDWINKARVKEPNGFFESLLQFESVLVHGAADALDRMREFWERAESRPSEAIEHLAEFGAKATATFGGTLHAAYGSRHLRPLKSMLFVEAARAIGPSQAAPGQPSALLSLNVLKEGVDYDLASFLDDEPPAPDQIALRQRIVAL